MSEPKPQRADRAPPKRPRDDSEGGGSSHLSSGGPNHEPQHPHTSVHRFGRGGGSYTQDRSMGGRGGGGGRGRPFPPSHSISGGRGTTTAMHHHHHQEEIIDGYVLNLHPIITPKDKLPDEILHASEEDVLASVLANDEAKGYGAQPSSGAASSSSSSSGLSPAAAFQQVMQFPYRVHFNDHFETSMDALRDLLPAIEAYRQLLYPNAPENFTLYDPYYCAGAVKAQWHALGISKVVHEKRDFYMDIEEGTVPAYDMLVTNPPYSGDHMEKLLEFLSASGKAWAFLVPDYVATKDWYVKMIETCYTANTTLYLGENRHVMGGNNSSNNIGSGGSSAGKGNRSSSRYGGGLNTNTAAAAIPRMPFPLMMPSTSDSAAISSSSSTATTSAGPLLLPVTTTVGVEPFYIVPRVWYDFKHPQGVGKEHSHFKSMWFVWCGRRTNEVIRQLMSSSRVTEEGRRTTTVVPGLAGLRAGGHIRTEQRKNPVARRNLKQ